MKEKLSSATGFSLDKIKEPLLIYGSALNDRMLAIAGFIGIGGSEKFWEPELN